MLVAFVVVAAWLSLGLSVAWNADGAWWSAAVLFAEPAILVLSALVGLVLVLRGAGLIGLGWALGAVTFTLLVRVPRAGSSQVGDTPAWIEDAQRCAGTLELPTASFTLLQWTLDPSVADDVAVDVVRRSTADVVVLYDVPRGSLADAVHEAVGGESRVIGADRPLAVFTRGAFHPCADEAVLLPLRTRTAPYGLSFVGTQDGASFPLLFGALPRLSDPDWTGAAREQRMVLGSIAGALQSSKLVIALDSGGPWTWTRLNARFAAVGMRLAWSPPDWPSRLGPLPWLPLHAMQRVWTAPSWRPIQSVVLRAPAGRRAPIVTVMDTVVHTAG